MKGLLISLFKQERERERDHDLPCFSGVARGHCQGQNKFHISMASLDQSTLGGYKILAYWKWGKGRAGKIKWNGES